MSSGYPSTVILEANRRSSEEFKSGNFTNPSLFTNKVNDGFKINTGDVISVHSAYISELGAEGSEIEIKGIALNASKSVEITQTSHQSNTSYTNEVVFGQDERYINGHLLNSLVSSSYTINFRDDTLQMIVSPYKNANAEFYISLPWNYAYYSSRSEAQEATAWFDAQPSLEPTPSATATFGSIYTGNTTLLPFDKTWNRTDKRKYYPASGTTTSGSATVAVRNDNTRYAIFQNKDVIHTYGIAPDDVATAITEAQKGIKWGSDPSGNSISISNASYLLGDRQDRPVHGIYRDIALHPYTRIKTLLSASANLGYNSPSDVAAKITEDLLRTVDIKKKSVINTNVATAAIVNKKTVISTSAENQVNKLYKCASPWSYSSNNASRFNNWDNADTFNDRIIEYISAHETIGVKRPDLYEFGREIMPSEGYVLQSAYERDSSTKLLQTSIPWTSQNLKNLSDLIAIQQRYPELVDSDNLNGENFPELRGSSQSVFSAKDNLWFLHLNMSASNCSTLGYDLNDTRAAYWQGSAAGQANQGALQPSASMSTAPIFLSFNPETRDKDENHISGFNFDTSVYGFAVKHTTADSEEFISVKVFGVYKTTDKSRFFQTGDQPVQLDNIPKLTRIGWDYHFTAYGCPCIVLYNGMNGLNGTGYQRQGRAMTIQTEEVPAKEQQFLTLGDKIPEIYLGSPNISLAFAPDVDRFEWRNFHTSEVIGNLYNAGYKAESLYTIIGASGTSGSGVRYTNPDATPIPENPNSSVAVYKINKQLLKNNWTPIAASYLNDIDTEQFFTRFTATNNGSHTAIQSFPFLNPALPTNSIYDSQCGLFVLDWGVDEKSWNNSLWGIMGFKYQQTTGTAGNQTRVINSNDWSGMLENTTNADITNTDFDKLTRNMFGAPTYNLNPPCQQTPFFKTYSGNASHRYLPTISIPQETGQPLRALNIPTRTLRPYYTIRSNIINGKSSYFGGSGTGVSLPVVAVVDKVSNSGDFFNIDNNDLTFTATQPYTLSDITTSICDPDGSYSKLSDNSAVLYKVQRTIPADTNVVENILKEYQNKKKELLEFETAVNAPTPTTADIKGVLLQMIDK